MTSIQASVPPRKTRAKKQTDIQSSSALNKAGEGVVVLDKKNQVPSATNLSTNAKKDNTFVSHEMSQDHILELRTINGTVFKGIIESLKNVLHEANLIFTEEGLKMTMIDSNCICAAHLSLDASYFEVYHCRVNDQNENKLKLGVDLLKLQKLIKPLKMNEHLCFIVHKDRRDVLQVVIENPEDGRRSKTVLKLKMLEDDYTITQVFAFNIPPPEINSTFFQNLCRNLHTANEQLVEITYSYDRLWIKGLTSDIEPEYEIMVAPPAGDESPECTASSEVVKGRFLLGYLHNFTKAAHHLSRRVRISLNDNNFLLIEYIINANESNSLKYILFQRPEDAAQQEPKL